MTAPNLTLARTIRFKQSRAHQQTVLDHLTELRSRLFMVILALCAGTGLGYAFHDQLVRILMAPLGQEKLIYLTPGGGFDFIFQVSLYAGLVVAIPVIVFELYRYLAPVMKRRQTRRQTAWIMCLASGLAIAGVAFGYFVALPAALHFLTTFAGDYVQPNLTASSYLSFVVTYSLGLAALFQLPIILLFINTTSGPLKPGQLLGSERIVILGAFILAAIITPTPDIFNQTLVAAPIIAVYQLGVLVVWLQNRKNSTAEPRSMSPASFVGPPRSDGPRSPEVITPLIATAPTIVPPRRSSSVYVPERPSSAKPARTPAFVDGVFARQRIAG